MGWRAGGMFPHLCQTPVSSHMRTREAASGDISAGHRAGNELLVFVSPGLESQHQLRQVELHIVVSLPNVGNCATVVVGPHISAHYRGYGENILC